MISKCRGCVLMSNTVCVKTYLKLETCNIENLGNRFITRRHKIYECAGLVPPCKMQIICIYERKGSLWERRKSVHVLFGLFGKETPFVTVVIKQLYITVSLRDHSNNDVISPTWFCCQNEWPFISEHYFWITKIIFVSLIMTVILNKYLRSLSLSVDNKIVTYKFYLHLNIYSNRICI